MNEKALPVLEQYNVEIKNLKRVRGCYCCDTDKGLMLLKEYENSIARATIIEAVQKYMVQNNLDTDLIIRNTEGNLTSIGPDGGMYVLKHWFEYRDCDYNNKSDVLLCMESMAGFHRLCGNMKQYLNGYNIYLESDLKAMGVDELNCNEQSDHAFAMATEGDNLSADNNLSGKEYSQDKFIKIKLSDNIRQLLDKHNRELIRVERFLGKRKKKTDFEYELEKCVHRNIGKALELTERISYEEADYMQANAIENMSLCHGSCRYHNFIFAQEMPCMINFVKLKVGSKIEDIYTFMRKIIEKNEFDIDLVDNMLKQYQSINRLEDTELKILQVMMDYPFKLWKIANSYLNSGKTGYALKNREKLDKFIMMEDKMIFN